MSPRILGVEVCAHSEGFGGRENAADVPDSGQEAVFVPWILRRRCQFTSSKLFVREIYLKNICFNCSYCEAKRSNNWKLKVKFFKYSLFGSADSRPWLSPALIFRLVPYLLGVTPNFGMT